jgi:ABC-type proline/glycine betaine transport system permease subunit
MNYENLPWLLADWFIEGIAMIVIIAIFGNGLGWVAVRLATPLGTNIGFSELVGISFLAIVLGILMEKIQRIDLGKRRERMSDNL